MVVRASPREVQGSAQHQEGKDEEKHGPWTDLLAHLWIAFCACVREVCDVKSTTARTGKVLSEGTSASDGFDKPQGLPCLASYNRRPG